jgi:riboflavin synthase
MFTGIVETIGRIINIIPDGSNKIFWIESTISSSFKIDQSVSHSGVCLTIEEIKGNQHRVTAISETLQKTNLDAWTKDSLINIEQSLLINSRLDGHFVQGHVDCTATCIKRKKMNGSWEFEFEFPKKFAKLVIEKGSVCVNGISLTLFTVKKKSFCVAVIPYTLEHTNIKQVYEGDQVNLEFDMIGKYIYRYLNTK